MKIKHYEKMAYTPALRIAVEGWQYLLTEKLCPDAFMLQWDQQALVAFDEETAVGIITFSKIDWQNEIFISIGYVKPDFRKRGIYMKLWKELVKRAKKMGVHHIGGSTNITNSDMRAVAKKQGRKETGVHLLYVLDYKE